MEVKRELKEYILSLIDIKYTWWNEESGIDMFYVDKIPEISEIRRIGINCAGLINIIRQKSGLTVPELKDSECEVRGGTYHYYEYFEENKVLEEFDIRKEYPEYTLLLRRYRDVYDQGHLAMIINKNEIIHAYAEDELTGRVGITKLEDSHYYMESGYYEYVVRPENWLKI
jgi:hypothetical protein